MRKPAAHAAPASDFGAADILDDDGQGLHGKASFYGRGFHGRRTSTGERYDIKQFTAASNRFPLGALVAVRRVDNDRCAIVKINDRMHSRHRQRVIDVSHSAAEYLGMLRAGVVLVRVAPLKGNRAGDAEANCQSAFDPATTCDACGDAQPRLPDLSPGT